MPDEIPASIRSRIHRTTPSDGSPADKEDAIFPAVPDLPQTQAKKLSALPQNPDNLPPSER